MNSVIKLLIIMFILVPTMISSLVWAGISAGLIWGATKIDKKSNAEKVLTPSIISLVVSVLLLGGSIYGTVVISNIND